MIREKNKNSKGSTRRCGVQNFFHWLFKNKKMIITEAETLIKRSIRAIETFKHIPVDKIQEVLFANEGGKFQITVLNLRRSI